MVFARASKEQLFSMQHMVGWMAEKRILIIARNFSLPVGGMERLIFDANLRLRSAYRMKSSVLADGECI